MSHRSATLRHHRDRLSGYPLCPSPTLRPLFTRRAGLAAIQTSCAVWAPAHRVGQRSRGSFEANTAPRTCRILEDRVRIRRRRRRLQSTAARTDDLRHAPCLPEQAMSSPTSPRCSLETRRHKLRPHLRRRAKRPGPRRDHRHRARRPRRRFCPSRRHHAEPALAACQAALGASTSRELYGGSGRTEYAEAQPGWRCHDYSTDRSFFGNTKKFRSLMSDSFVTEHCLRNSSPKAARARACHLRRERRRASDAMPREEHQLWSPWKSSRRNGA